MIGKNKLDPLVSEMLAMADEYQQERRELLAAKSAADREESDTRVLNQIEEDSIETEDAFGNRTFVKTSVFNLWKEAQEHLREVFIPERNSSAVETEEVLGSFETEKDASSIVEAEIRHEEETSQEAANTLSEGFSLSVETVEEKLPEPTRIQEEDQGEYAYQINYTLTFSGQKLTEICYVRGAKDEEEAKEFFLKKVPGSIIDCMSRINVCALNPANRVLEIGPVCEPEEKSGFKSLLKSFRNPLEETGKASVIDENKKDADSPEKESLEKTITEEPQAGSVRRLGSLFSRKEKTEVPDEPSSEIENTLQAEPLEYIGGIRVNATQMLNEQPDSVKSQQLNVESIFTLTDLVTGVTTVIDKSPYHIGCKKEVCDLVISQDAKVHTVSRMHAIINVKYGKAYIEDRSANGTFLAGPGSEELFSRLPKEQEVALRPGQIIKFADHCFRFDVRRED